MWEQLQCFSFNKLQMEYVEQGALFNEWGYQFSQWPFRGALEIVRECGSPTDKLELGRIIVCLHTLPANQAIILVDIRSSSPISLEKNNYILLHCSLMLTTARISWVCVGSQDVSITITTTM